jgi:hypothetical protein
VKTRIISCLVATIATLGLTLSLGVSPASAAVQTCRNVEYTAGSLWARVCLTYTWSPTGATYRVNELRTWNKAGTGTSVLEGMQREYDNSPYVTLDDDFVLNDGETAIMGDFGVQPSASQFQCSQFRGPDGQVDALLTRPSGSNLNNGSCAANGVG